jgi:hypothetical protein
MDKLANIILSPDEKFKKEKTTPNRLRDSISSNKKITSGSKQRFSDRFIPSSINKNLMSEFESTCQSSKKSITSKKLAESKTEKPENLYQKILHSEILEERTPSNYFY